MFKPGKETLIAPDRESFGSAGESTGRGMSTSEDGSPIIDVRSMGVSSCVLACHVAFQLM